MSPDRHAEIKQTFTVAAELSGAQRTAYLDDACAEDPELRAEVESLLRHHDTQTLIQDAPRWLSPVDKDFRPLGPAAPTLATRLIGTAFRRAITLALGSALIFGFGAWVHTKVEESLTELRAEELRAILDASSATLELWIHERLRDARSLAHASQVRDLVRATLVAGESKDERAQAELVARFRTIALDYLHEVRPHEVIVIGRDGVLLHDSGSPSLAGASLRAPKAYAYLVAALDGQTVFVPPYRAMALSEALDSPEERRRQIVRVWFLAPVLDDQGQVIAAIAFSKLAEEEFSRTLEQGRLRNTLETYAFDSELRMLSKSRFPAKDLETVGTATASISRGLLEHSLIDPRTGQPTSLAEQARTLGPKGHEHGELMQAYSGYRGHEVVGSWRWLKDHRFAVVTEIEAEEAFQSLQWLDASIGLLFGLLLLASASSFVSALSIVRLRAHAQATQLGPYTLGQKIGEGGMGEVFLAQHRLLKRPTAVKVLRTTDASSRALQRFEKEVQLTSLLTHPNTIAVYDYGHTADGTFFFAMEYLHGLNLSEVVALGGPLPEARVVHILLQVCGSLREAHGRGLVHRDIKPGNIMLCERGGELDFVKVLDFGLAKDLSEGSSKPSFGALHGTPRYMAPERLDDPTTVDARTDIFAVGAVGYYLLVGEHAFSGSSPSSIHEGVQSATPPDPAARLGRPLSPGLVACLMQCMSKAPEDRPASAAALHTMLEAIDDVGPWSQFEAAAWWTRRFESTRGSAESDLSV